MSQRIATYHLDANAGIPLRPEVLEALLPFLKQGSESLLGNPSSAHSFGRNSRQKVHLAAEQVAAALSHGVDPDDLLFTSSGTEANQTAIRSVLEAALKGKHSPHWITTEVEHDATLRMVEWFKSRGGETSFLPVDRTGRPEVARLDDFVQAGTCLVSAIWANNETGVITDVQGLAGRCARLGIALHLDAAQAWGKLPLDLNGATFVSFSGPKIGALGGTGVLWRRKKAPILPLLMGHQQAGLRGGTENVLGLISLGAAAAAVGRESEANAWIKSDAWREGFESKILACVSGAKINGFGAPRLANTINVAIHGVKASELVAGLDIQGFAVSAGSACSSGLAKPSRVLLAMGNSPDEAQSAIRISVSEAFSEEVQDSFCAALAKTVSSLRQSPKFL